MKKKLYTNYYDIIIIKNRKKNLIFLLFIFYIFNLGVNFLFNKKIYKKKLKKNFN